MTYRALGQVQAHQWGTGLPYPQLTFPLGVGVWPYPSVPAMGYNLVPLKVLLFGDHAMPLGDHLTPATKEKIQNVITLTSFYLLNRKVDKKDIDKEDEREKERSRRQMLERT